VAAACPREPKLALGGHTARRVLVDAGVASAEVVAGFALVSVAS
jgi:hypothetical protein